MLRLRAGESCLALASYSGRGDAVRVASRGRGDRGIEGEGGRGEGGRGEGMGVDRAFSKKAEITEL